MGAVVGGSEGPAVNTRLATWLGISQEDIDGPWQCRKCHRCGNIWWAAFHLHRKARP